MNMNLPEIIETLTAAQAELVQLRADKETLTADKSALMAELDSIRHAAAPKRWQVGFINQAAPGGTFYVGGFPDILALVRDLGYPSAIIAPDNQYAVIVESDLQPASFDLPVQTQNTDTGEWSEGSPMRHEFILLS